MSKHRWQASKALGGFVCSDCRRHVSEREDSACLAAHHSDPTVNRLYRERRKAASAANGSGFSAHKGWADLEAIGQQLAELDPDGDWFYEGDLWDGSGWQVRRPESSHTEAFAKLTAERTAERAAEARAQAEAREEADRLRLAGLTDDRSTKTGHPGQVSATQPKTEVTPMSKSPTTTKSDAEATTAEAPAIDLHAMLQAQLAEVGVKVKPRWSGSGSYASYLVEGRNIGYVFRQTAQGTIKAKPGVTMADLPRGLKASFRSNEPESKVYAVLGSFGEKDLGKLTQALQLAASFQAEARAAKPKASTKKASTKKAAKAEPVEVSPADQAALAEVADLINAEAAKPKAKRAAKPKAAKVEVTAEEQAASEQLAAAVILGEVTFEEAARGILGDLS